MYKNIKFEKPKLDMQYLSENAKDLCSKLLVKEPSERLGFENDADDIKNHPWFDVIDWNAISEKKVPPPYTPQLDQSTDTKHFPPEFTLMPLSPKE